MLFIFGLQNKHALNLFKCCNMNTMTQVKHHLNKPCQCLEDNMVSVPMQHTIRISHSVFVVVIYFGVCFPVLGMESSTRQALGTKEAFWH
jgi:hypothetical protein